MIRPTQNPVTLPFGATTDPYTPQSPHIGVDFSPNPDNAIYAPEDGRIVLILGDPKMGDSIHLYAGNRHHALCHTSQHFVQTNQIVKQGDRLGIMGQTGFAFGVHLHWALTLDGVLVDPLTQVKENDMPNEGDVDNAYLQANGRKATAEEKAIYTKKPWSAPDGLYYGKIRVDFENAKNSQKPVQTIPLTKGNIYEVK